jgi:hypothetical protein
MNLLYAENYKRGWLIDFNLSQLENAARISYKPVRQKPLFQKSKQVWKDLAGN